jgi:hypothetical protein
MEVQPKLLTIPKAAKVIGEDKEIVRAWTRRAVDPLPTVVSGAGTGKRVVHKVVMAAVDPWLARNSTGRE